MSNIVSADIRQKLAKFSNLPSIPQIILEIKEVSDDPKASAADLANCILSDHQLTARILRMANSAYYGDFAGKITTVTHGIVVMGFRAVHNIAVSMAIYGVVSDISRNTKFDMTAFWTRSLACGVIAKYLARCLDRPKLLETAFIAGFLHDIGQVILASIFPNKYEQLSRLESQEHEICSAEKVLLGIDHQEAGEFVAQKWNLPTGLALALSDHHRLGTAVGQASSNLLVDLVYLGDLLYPHVMATSPPEQRTLQPVLKCAKNLVNISDEQLAALLVDCRQQVTEIAGDLEIDIKGELRDRAPSEADLVVLNDLLSSKEIQLAFLQNATSALMEAKANDEILQIICEATYRGLQMGRVILFECDPDGSCFRGRVGFGISSQGALKDLQFEASEGLFGHLTEYGQPVTIVGDNEKVYGAMITADQIARLEANAFAALPIKIFGNVKYVIFADGPDRSTAIDDEALRSMMSLANQGAMSLERRYLEEQLKNRQPV